MPIYTYKCRHCGMTEEFLKSIGDSQEPLCSKCCYNPNIQGDDEKMTRIYKPNAKPGSKDGSWGFGGKKDDNYRLDEPVVGS